MERRGFTLIEILVALLIAGILAAGAAELISLSLALKRKADVHAAAARLVIEKLEDLRSLPFGDEALLPGARTEAVPAADGEGAFLREWAVDDVSPGIKRVSVRVASRGRTVARAVLLISRDLGFGP